MSAEIKNLSVKLGEVTVQRSNREQQWESFREANDQRLANLEAGNRESDSRIQALTKDLETARAQNQVLETAREEQAKSHATKLKELSDASAKKWEAEIKKRLAEQKAEMSVDSLPTTSQMLRRFIQSQFTSIGIPEDDKSVDDVAREWNTLLDTAPTMRAGVEVPPGQYILTFVVSPFEVVMRQAADAIVAQIWLLTKSNPDVLLSIRHFAQRPDISASQLNVLQDILLTGISVIMEGAYCREVFGRILVAVHALGWLYIRVGALSDSVERKSVLINTWNELSAWLLSKKAASDILYQVSAATYNSFEATYGVSRGVLSVGPNKADWLGPSNSALEEGQSLVPDLAMHMAAWAVGDRVTIFSRADVFCVDYNAATCEIVLRFRESAVEICLCRQVGNMAPVVGWVQKLLGDDCFNIRRQ